MSKFSPEVKVKAVELYLNGTFSVSQISCKLECAESVIKSWIAFYRQYGPDYFLPQKKIIRRGISAEIVRYCIDHNMNYKETARIFNVSYSQVYDWVRKYTADKEEGLEDRRGHHKSDDEVDEVERLKREVARLKRALEEKDMLAELLKKVRELEGK